MPFDFKSYDAKCQGLTAEELQREWQHYTRLISGAATSTAVSGLAVPFTLGVSTIGVAVAAPAIHNARKKREIIEKHLNRHNATHVTRKRDVIGSMAVSGTIGVVTLGVGSMGADAIATSGAEHGISAIVENELAVKVVTHAALDGAGLAVEHAHTGHLKKKDAHKAFQAAGVFQAVQDAKAAEAGYSIAPYNPQAVGAGSSSGQPMALPPPPPYNVAMAYTQTQLSNQTGYPPDFKAPVPQTPAIPGQHYVPPGGYAPQPIPQPYGQPSGQHQLYLQPIMAGATSTIVPPYQAPPQFQAPSEPWSSRPGVSVNAAQLTTSYQQPAQYSQSMRYAAIPSYSPATGSVSGTYDMKALNDALPAPTPHTYAVTPVQPSALTTSIPQLQSTTKPLSTQSYTATPTHMAHSGAPPPVHDSAQVPGGSFQQPPAVHGFPTNYQQYTGYPPQQPPPSQSATGQVYPPPPPDQPNANSEVNMLQPPFSPQQSIAASQPMHAYASSATQQPQLAPSSAPPPTPSPCPPQSQTPSTPQNTQNFQVQYNPGTYAPLPSPPQHQQQQQYETIAPRKAAPQAYQSQPYSHSQNPAPNYPPTPISLPNSPPVAQHTGSGYFPPPPACAPQPHQWNGQVQGNMAYTPAQTPGTPWQPQGTAQAYTQYQQ